MEAIYHINDMDNFLRNQAYDVLRRVCGKFPYRSNDPNQPTLLDDSSAISKHMKDMLQTRCHIAGLAIQRMDLMEIAYHPVMAQALL